MIDLVSLIILVLAGYRLTRLIIEDEILDTPREWVRSKFKPNGKADYLLGCPWCMGFWVALIIAIMYLVIPTAMMVVALPLALSAAIGLIYQKVG